MTQFLYYAVSSQAALESFTHVVIMHLQYMYVELGINVHVQRTTLARKYTHVYVYTYVLDRGELRTVRALALRHSHAPPRLAQGVRTPRS